MKQHVSILLLAIFSASTSASIDSAFKRLNTKMSMCMALVGESQVETNDKWLISLDEDSIKLALLLLKDLAMHKCTEVEEKEYLYQLYLEYVTTNDIEPLNRWLNFKESGLINAHREITTKSFLEQVSRLSKTPEFSQPFDVLEVLQLLQKKT
ncbi:hypothetical protein MD535_24450 [Vibrio sp. ZSDZ65]|uniref:Uncharacterized protein n=1 Tax=Vibrio qingdaonensis TaxID=2829491 RepID=A0A9X3CSV6_9VIBR|nr:hypothetical protein [Vibrio qingdaonensis]MCW8349142.1 hypothetical protein [Vibrio qingdaonensis]